MLPRGTQKKASGILENPDGGLSKLSRVAFRQADLERVFKAAAKAGCLVQMDMKTLIVTVIPPTAPQPVDEYGNSLGLIPSGNYAPDGKENWDDE